MLVLTRRAGEKIMVGDGIVVEVLQIHGNRIRLGLHASSEVRILRAELAERELEVHHGSH